MCMHTNCFTLIQIQYKKPPFFPYCSCTLSITSTIRIGPQSCMFLSASGCTVYSKTEPRGFPPSLFGAPLPERSAFTNAESVMTVVALFTTSFHDLVFIRFLAGLIVCFCFVDPC